MLTVDNEIMSSEDVSRGEQVDDADNSMDSDDELVGEENYSTYW